MQQEHEAVDLEHVAKIYRSMLEYTGGDRCLVVPHPDLTAKIHQQMQQLRDAAGGQLANLVRIRDRSAPGLNDGLIYPGEMFPLGTPVQVVRSAAADRAPLRGAVRVLVVLADFKDRKFGAANNKKYYEDLFFSIGVLPNGSVREYYREVTNNLIDIVGEVVGAYRMPKNIVDYAHRESGTGAALPNARTLARDAAEAADAVVNYAQYDNDGDGFVDAFIVIHAGAGAEVTGSPDDIWSHKWVLSGGAYNADNTKIYAYLTVPEDAKIGVCCHELGHLLFGFPDLYDTDYSSEGVGNWCLMGGGSWNGNGEIPAHPSAWCKANQGWVSIANQTANARLNIPDVKTNHSVVRLWKDGAAGSEYFLLENRQKTLYDRELPGAGLLIWHVDESIAGNSDENHPKVALIQADGNRDLEKGTGRGDGGDPFPGDSNNTAFNSSSTPGSRSYAGTSTCVAVNSIGVSGPVMTVDLEVKCVVKSLLKDFKDRTKDKLEKDKFEKEGGKDKHEKDKFEKEGGKDKFEKDKFEKEIFEGKGPLGEAAGGFAQPAQPGAALGSLEARIAALEARIGSLEPFIGAGLRPDLSQGALAQEDDMAELRSQMERGAVGAKRLYDTQQTRP